MAKICVEIELDTDTGEYRVYECEPKDEMGELESAEPGGQSFASSEEALAAAAEMLQAGATSGGQTQTTDDLKAAMQGGYDRARGPMPSMKPPGGGMMFGEE